MFISTGVDDSTPLELATTETEIDLNKPNKTYQYEYEKYLAIGCQQQQKNHSMGTNPK